MKTEGVVLSFAVHGPSTLAVNTNTECNVTAPKEGSANKEQVPVQQQFLPIKQHLLAFPMLPPYYRMTAHVSAMVSCCPLFHNARFPAPTRHLLSVFLVLVAVVEAG